MTTERRVLCVQGCPAVRIVNVGMKRGTDVHAYTRTPNDLFNLEQPQSFPCWHPLKWPVRVAVDAALQMFFRRRPSTSATQQLTSKPDREAATVYTYHEEVRELGDQTDLISLWAESWRKSGWHPVVLGDEHAHSHPGYRRYLQAVRRHPTANPKNYELACFKRWLAMVEVGGGWMVDYDVINYGFAPTAPTTRLTLYTGDWCPCVTSGSRGSYERAVEAFEAYTGEYEIYPGRPHLSDQDILKHRRDLYDSQSVCVNYSVPGWETSKLVHYPNGLMAQWQPRARHIPELRRCATSAVAHRPGT